MIIKRRALSSLACALPDKVIYRSLQQKPASAVSNNRIPQLLLKNVSRTPLWFLAKSRAASQPEYLSFLRLELFLCHYSCIKQFFKLFELFYIVWGRRLVNTNLLHRHCRFCLRRFSFTLPQNRPKHRNGLLCLAECSPIVIGTNYSWPRNIGNHYAGVFHIIRVDPQHQMFYYLFLHANLSTCASPIGTSTK